MAARKNIAPLALNLPNVVSELNKLKASADNPVQATEVAKTFQVDASELLAMLDTTDKEGNVVDGGVGTLWLTNAQSQTGLTRAQVIKDAKAVSVDTPPAAPVFSEESEVPAPQNQEKNMDTEKTVKVTGWVNDGGETHFVEFDPANVTGHMILPQPETVEAPPEGVNANFWDQYVNAHTAPSRIFWGNKVAEQIKAHALSLLEKEETPAPIVSQTVWVDPVTGEPIPF